MIYIHKDTLYSDKQHLVFKALLDKKKIDNVVLDLQDLDVVNKLNPTPDDVMIARFAHHKEDKLKTESVIIKLSQKFKHMYPSLNSYSYYDDKFSQYVFMLNNKLPCLETFVAESKEDIEKLDMDFPIVTKKTWGAGSEQVNYFETLDSVVDDETTRSWTGDSIYPCLVQEYEDVDYDIRIHIYNNKALFYKRIHKWKTENRSNFPYGGWPIPVEERIKNKLPPFDYPWPKDLQKSEIEDVIPFTEKINHIQRNLLDTYCMSWDLLKTNSGYKIVEFSVIASLDIGIPYFYYDLVEKEFVTLSRRKSIHFLYEEIINSFI